MTARLRTPPRYARAALLVVFAAIGLGIVTSSPNAAGGGQLTVTPVTWDVVGLDSNNVNTGPNVFPVGVRVCNTGSEAAANVVATWAWRTSQNSFTGPADGTAVTVGTMAVGACRQVFFEVTLNRSPSSRLKSRDYQITVTGGGGLTASTAQRQLYTEKLVSQNRNSTKKLAGPGGCNLTYAVCDPAVANVIVGKTYTYKFYAETSTAYQQLETFVNFPASAVQVVSTSSTYSNPSGAASGSLYADACGWSTIPTNRSCTGPANIPGGKAGGRIVVTYVVRAVAPGSGTLRSTIYDFSGSSYHYNSDHDTFALTSGPYTARYGVDTTIVGNGKVTSSPSGTRPNGTSGGIDCGGAGVACSVGYATGTNVTLTAQPLGSDTFVGWSGGGCAGTSLTCTVTMSESRSVTATFTGVTSYPLEVARNGSGSVAADTGALDCGATCATRYADGTVVTLTAAPSTGWTFEGWSGEGCTGTGSCQVTMSQARSVTAIFGEQTFPLSVSVTGNGTVASSVGTINCGNGNTFCSEVYGAGTTVTLSATPGSGQLFVGWLGADCLGVTPTCTVSMSQARSATAAFSGAASYPLEVGIGGSGTGTVTSNVGGINCGTTCSASFTDGTLVTLTATAASGSNLVGWSGDCSGTSTTCVVTMSQARNVFATFGAPQTLTVTKAGVGTGTVMSNVGTINCGTTCTASYAEATTVTLTATGSAGSTFTGWSGDCSGTGTTCVVTMSQARSVTATFATAFTLTVTKSGSGAGSVTSDVAGISCGSACSASYASGTNVTLTATAAAGSRFAGWSGAGCTGTAPCTVTMSAARAVTATFVALHPLTVTKSGSGSGTVAGTGIDCGTTCEAEYDHGAEVTLTATSASGSRFAGWSGAGCSGTAPCTVTMSAVRAVTATFVALHPLTVTKSGAGSGTVTGGRIDCGTTCAAEYDDGAEVTLTAGPATGSRFVGWSGAGCTGTGVCTVTMSAARAVTASFVAVYPLTVTKSGSGSGTVTGGGIDCGSTCSGEFDDEIEITLAADASPGSRFTGWTGAGCTGTASCTVTMSAARAVTATFVALHPLEVTKTGSGTGAVTGEGVDCGTTCEAEYDDGAEVTITATAAPGSRFAGWSGAGCSGTGPCVVTMSAARAVTATFLSGQILTVVRDGSGNGSVSADEIDCGATCSAEYDDGAEVTVTATPAPGSRFAGWSGAGCTGTDACRLTMNAARSITATFVAVHRLTATKAGSGSGTLAGDEIDCGGTCTADYDEGTVVRLTATPSPGSRFTGWTGGGCFGSDACSVTMSAAHTVTATFVAAHALTVTKAGSGGGTITSDVPGVVCGAACVADYDEGTEVTLTAVAAAGSRFAGWSGAGCTGTAPCTVTMNAARAVTASFVAVHPLTVTKTGSGSGTVTGGGIDCGPICAGEYDDGTELTLTAAPAAGSRFAGWSGGGCTGTGGCTVTMDAARTVTAAFETIEAPTPETLHLLTVAKAGSGSGVVTGTDVDCGATCSASFADGATIVLTAAADAGSRFAGWSGDGCTNTGPCVVTMTAARSVTATFVRVVTLRVSVDGRGTVRYDGSRCGADCRARYDAGRQVTLVARARPGHWFTGWSGACRGSAPTCTVTVSGARHAVAHFRRALELGVRTTGGLVYHLPYERAFVRAVATWRGRPLAGADVSVVVRCPGRRLSVTRQTGRDGRAVFPIGTHMPNAVRAYRCAITAHIVANRRRATAPGPATLRFIHPIWLETKGRDGRRIVVRIWGRAGERVNLLADGKVVVRARIGAAGWVEVAPRGIRRGTRLHATGRAEHHSHVITV